MIRKTGYPVAGMKVLLFALVLAASTTVAQDSSCPAPRGNNVVIEGYVDKPGVYPVPSSQERRLMLSAVIAQAGGLAPGSARVVFILRRDENGIAHPIPVRLQVAASDVELRAGDIVAVPDESRKRIRGCFRSSGQL